MDLSAEFLPFAGGVPILNITDNYLGKDEVTVRRPPACAFHFHYILYLPFKMIPK